MNQEQKDQNSKTLTDAHHNHEKGLNSHAFFKTDSHAVGEDLVQETFMKTWIYLARGGKIEIMKAFLYHILNNLIVDEYRKHKATSLDVLLEKGFDLGSDSSETLSNVLDGKGAILLIQRLPKTYQKVMRMKYVNDLSLEEMSLITGQTRNAIAVQLHRGLTKLRLLYNF